MKETFKLMVLAAQRAVDSDVGSEEDKAILWADKRIRELETDPDTLGR